MSEAAAMIMIYTTFANESDARNLGAQLVELGLAACVNIFPGMISVYRWQDSLETANETAMIVKTGKELQSQALDAIAARLYGSRTDRPRALARRSEIYGVAPRSNRHVALADLRPKYGRGGRHLRHFGHGASSIGVDRLDLIRT
jgi:periplasmic divalent cation tolerance protein